MDEKLSFVRTAAIPIVKKVADREAEARKKEREIDSDDTVFATKIGTENGTSKKNNSIIRGTPTLVSPGRYLRGKITGAVRSYKMHFCIDSESKRIIKQIALTERISISEIIRRAIWCYLSVRGQYFNGGR